MKKVFSVIVLTAIIFFCGQNKTFASDYYVGDYENGFKAYFMSETLNFIGGFRNFDVTIKILKNNQIDYVNYEFRGGPGNRDMAPYQNFKNSKGKSGDKILSGTLESNILGLANKFWQGKISSSNESDTSEEIFATKFFGIEIYVLPKTITRTSNGFSLDVKLKDKEKNITGINKYYFYNNGNINTDEKNVTYYITPGKLFDYQKLDSVSRPIYRICKQYL